MALLLTWEAGLVPEEGFSLYGKITALGLSYDKEPAGHIFHQVALKQHGLHKDDEDRSDDSSSSESGKMSGPSHASSLNDFSSLDQDSGSSKYKGKGKKKNLKKRGVDVYALLGLQYERWMASADQIKNAYRRSALLHHPDKQGIDSSDEAAKQAAEEKFKAIQEAYETLSDASRRREFDSLDDFDDSLPGVLSDGADFYMIFGSAFARNARWASKKPVPELGNDQTPYRDVDKFYDYWYGFKSWREFPHPDEEDVEGAECREHRRLIERHNNKLREQGRRAEAKRLRELVESAARQDPRLARRRAEEKAAKEARRLAKENERLARVRAEEEEKAAEAAAAAKEAEEQAQRKREAAAGRKALKNERSLLRKLVAANEALQSCAGEGGAEKLSTTLSLEELRALNKELRDKEAPEEARVRALNERMGGLRLEAEREEAARAAAVAAAEKAAAERAQREGAARQASLASWSDEEVRLLQKALEKWPPGTIKRWNVIQGYLQTRTAEEITVMVKHGLKARAAALVSDGYEVAAKRQGNTIIQSEATDRLASFTDVQIPREEDNNSSTDQQLNGTTWTPEAELALIKALKVVTKDAEDRWGAVADLVPGKTKAQCFLRFKEMKAAHKSKPN